MDGNNYLAYTYFGAYSLNRINTSEAACMFIIYDSKWYHTSLIDFLSYKNSNHFNLANYFAKMYCVNIYDTMWNDFFIIHSRYCSTLLGGYWCAQKTMKIYCNSNVVYCNKFLDTENDLSNNHKFDTRKITKLLSFPT